MVAHGSPAEPAAERAAPVEPTSACPAIASSHTASATSAALGAEAPSSKRSSLPPSCQSVCSSFVSATTAAVSALTAATSAASEAPAGVPSTVAVLAGRLSVLVLTSPTLAFRLLPTMYPSVPAAYEPGTAVAHGSPAEAALFTAAPRLPAAGVALLMSRTAAATSASVAKPSI